MAGCTEVARTDSATRVLNTDLQLDIMGIPNGGFLRVQVTRRWQKALYKSGKSITQAGKM
jgi:hypothetical protein